MAISDKDQRFSKNPLKAFIQKTLYRTLGNLITHDVEQVLEERESETKRRLGEIINKLEYNSEENSNFYKDIEEKMIDKEKVIELLVDQQREYFKEKHEELTKHVNINIDSIKNGLNEDREVRNNQYLHLNGMAFDNKKRIAELENSSDKIKEDRRKILNQQNLLNSVQKRVRILETSELEQKRSHPANINPLDIATQDIQNKSIGFDFDYEGFEAIYRGSEEKIAKILKERYFDLIENKNSILDIGCGRGEFLLELKERGKENLLGIDLNSDMVKTAREKGLDIIHGDAIAYLQSDSQRKFDAIFSSQVIEHLTPPQIIDLVKGAYEHLEDNGVLIMETVNPQALYTLGMAYAMDLTHVQPVHPFTIEFILNSNGYRNVELRYFENDRFFIPLEIEGMNVDEYNKSMEKLFNQIYGSQDYAVFGYK